MNLDAMRDRMTAIWPQFGLRLRTPRLELRVPLDVELAALARRAARGVHPPGESHEALGGGAIARTRARRAPVPLA